MECIFCNLAEIVETKNISDKCDIDKWRKINYETKLGKGTMILAAQGSRPEPIIFNINLKGWYRIYISLIKMRSDSYTHIKLTDDIWYTGIRPSSAFPPAKWCVSEYIEEVYWKSADLTNQKIIVAKPETTFSEITSGIVWIRCEEMTEDEVNKYQNNSEKNRCVQMHFDEDLYSDDVYKNECDYLMKPAMMKNSSVDFCSYEYSFDYDRCDKPSYLPILNSDKVWRNGDYKFNSLRDSFIKNLINFSKENNISLYAANRMSVSNFSTPYNRDSWNKKFVKNHPEFYCRNRDKSIVNVCSYAFDEVQQYVIGGMIEMIKQGFDGISMLYHRGMHIGFEKPVIDRFVKRYPNVDPFVLPVSDERLNGVWRDIMTEFMRKVKNTLESTFDRHIPINVITDYSLESSKNFGLDVEKWAEERLIDSASQADMETFEDLTDCMSDDNCEIIDMDKYKKRILDYPPIRRVFGTNVEYVCKNMKNYLALEEKYGVKIYNVLPWVHTVPIDQYEEIIEKMKLNGAKRFLSWNTNHLFSDLPEWHIVSSIGNYRDEKIVLRKHYRVLSLDNSCISHFNPNWRG